MPSSLWSHTSLLHPPNGVLKLIFDGSFLKDVRWGGYGGVIRDSMGAILCSYVGAVDLSNSNEAEVFALLVGCREFRRLDGYNALIEGDSFYAIQWSSGNATYLENGGLGRGYSVYFFSIEV